MSYPRAFLPLLLASACADLSLGEDWQAWYDDGSDYDVTEPVAFTAEPYDIPARDDDGIAKLKADVFTSTFSNLGPYFPPGSGMDEAVSGCAYWIDQEPDPVDADATDTDVPPPSLKLPRTITGVVTSHPRVYRKIEGCNGDEKYYGSYWIEDRTGGLFVLGDSKVAHFDMGDTVTLSVRSMRRRYDIDMVYVHDVLEVQRGPRPIAYDEVDRPLTASQQSTTVRATGVVVTEPTTFGEVLVQLDGYSGECAPTDERTRAHCLFVTIDQETSRRGVTLRRGDHIQVTGPVSQTAWFGPTGVFNFYGIYVMRVGQLTWLDGTR